MNDAGARAGGFVDFLNGVPAWVRALATVGFPILVTAFLLAQSAGWVPSEVRALNRVLEARFDAFDRHNRTTEELVASLRVAARIMCENAAATEQHRRNCEAIR